MVKVCRVCGEELEMRYPGGDPENGPAAFRCVMDSHSCANNDSYTNAILVADKIVEMFPQCTEEQFNSIVQLVMENES